MLMLQWSITIFDQQKMGFRDIVRAYTVDEKQCCAQAEHRLQCESDFSSACASYGMFDWKISPLHDHIIQYSAFSCISLM